MRELLGVYGAMVCASLSKHYFKIRHDPTPPQGGKELENMKATKLKEYNVKKKKLMLGRLSVINIQSE